MRPAIPKCFRKIRRDLKDHQFKRKFERETGYSIETYKNEAELATAYIIHRDLLSAKKVSAKYEQLYPNEHMPHRSVDWSLSEPIVIRDLPPGINHLKWPSGKPVQYIETKQLMSLVAAYPNKSEKEIDHLLRSKPRSVFWHALLQREFLKNLGIETFVIGSPQIDFFFKFGLLPDPA